MHPDGVTTCLIVALDLEVGKRVGAELHATGKPVLALDVVTELARLPETIRSWRPHVLVVDTRLHLDPQGVGLPLVPYDPAALDAETLAAQMLSGRPAAPLPPRPRLHHGVALGFQGIKGGVGTSTIAAGVAVAAAQSGYRAAMLDLAGDCALTLGAEALPDDPRLLLSRAAGTKTPIAIVQGAVDLHEAWSRFSQMADVVVVDAGRVGEHVAETHTLTRLGVRFFLVLTAQEMELLRPQVHPGYSIFLNREPVRSWWQWDVAGSTPEDPQMHARLNRGEFGAPCPFLLGLQTFVARAMRAEVA